MSMIASLNALEVATDATTVPRAAVFQPKVKPRLRKGGGGGETNTVCANLRASSAPRERVSKASANGTPQTRSANNVAAASEASAGSSELGNARFIVDTKHATGEESFSCDGGVTGTTDDITVTFEQNDVPKVTVIAPEIAITEFDRRLTDENPRAGYEQPPVAVRSNFPELPPGASMEEDRGLGQKSSSDRASKPLRFQDIGEPNSAECQNPDSSAGLKRYRGRRAGLKRQTAEDSRPVSRNTNEENVGGGEGATGVEDEAETVCEAVSASKKGRKRKFSHCTSQSRANQGGREEVVVSVDFSKTDLSNPAKLTMREIIRRAEAIERKKLKEDGNKKFTQNDGKQKQADPMEASERNAVSLTPQVQVINGRIVINEQSLTVGAYATSRLNTENYTRVEENTPRLNYNSYRDAIRTERWKAEDTDVFYLALKQFGTDFGLIQNLFPGRTRRQVKAKFKKEERNNPRRLQDALLHRPTDQAHYTDMINRLKADESDSTTDDPFASTLAYTNKSAPDVQIGAS